MTREELKAKAQELGISYNANIKTEALLELITNAENGISPELLEAEDKVKAESASLVENKDTVSPSKNTEARTIGQVKADARKEALRLVRCVVTSMDKDKAEIRGEIISCGNSMTGMIKKFIPFGKEWHVPVMLLDTIRDKKMLMTRDRRTERGVIKEHYEIAQYNIQILPDLTPEERKRLANEDKK